MALLVMLALSPPAELHMRCFQAAPSIHPAHMHACAASTCSAATVFQHKTATVRRN
jgi:hypothetical protein